MSTHVHAVSSTDEDEGAAKEVVCKRCYGTGDDRDGADCVHCDGNGTLLI